MQAEVTVMLLIMDIHIISLYNHTPNKYLYSMCQAPGTALNLGDRSKTHSLFSRLAGETDNAG